MRGSGTSSTPGGRMLETLIRLMLPMPAASRALSKALSGVDPSALPAVPAAFVTGAKCIRSLLLAGVTARRKFLAHRSGSAPERKQKVARDAARRTLRGRASARAEPAASARGRAGAAKN